MGYGRQSGEEDDGDPNDWDGGSDDDASGGGGGAIDYDFSAGNSQETLDRERERAQSQWARRNQKRLYLPVGAKKEIVFLDDDPFAIHEHNPLINGTRKGNWFTCIANLDKRKEPRLREFWGGCPFDGFDEYYYVAFVTCMILTPFKISQGPNRGKEIRNFRMLYPMKTKSMEEFTQFRRTKRGLVGAVFETSRTQQRGQPTTGVLKYLEHVNLDDPAFKIEGRDQRLYEPRPFDYRKILAPLPRSQLLAVADQIQNETRRTVEERRNERDADRDRGRYADRDEPRAGRPDRRAERPAPPADEYDGPGGPGGGQFSDDDIPF